MGGIAGVVVSVAVGAILAVVAAFTGASVIESSNPSSISAPLVVYGSR